MGKKSKKNSKNKVVQPEPEPEVETKIETKIEDNIQEDNIEVGQKGENNDNIEKETENKEEKGLKNQQEKEADSDDIVKETKEEKDSVKKQEQEQEQKDEVNEIQEQLETSTPVPTPQDLSILISDLATADPFSLTIETNQNAEGNKIDNNSEELNNSKEIDLSSLPVTPTDFKFNENENEIERAGNNNTNENDNENENENEVAGLEDPFSPQVESPPFESKEEQNEDNINESQGDLTTPNSIKQENEVELEPIQLDEPKIESKEQVESDKPTDCQEELKVLHLESKEFISAEISLSNQNLVKEIDKLPNLVDNSLFFDIPLNDPLHELTQLHLGSHIPKPNRYSATDLANDIDQSWQVTAQQLANTNRWRSLVGFTRHKLTNTPKQDIDSIMKLWEFRLTALANINLYQLASAELEKWGNILGSEYLYESYPNLFPNKIGYLIPFSILILWARLPSYLGNITKSIDRLYSLLIKYQILSKADKNEDYCLLIIQLIISLLIQIKDYSQATKLLDAILLKLNSNVYLLSNLGRLHLLGGNIQSAVKVFERLEQLTKESEDLEITLLNQLNKGLLLMTQGNWEEANDLLLELYQDNLNNITVLNALAVSKVYKGQHVEAIQMLQSKLTQPERPSEVGILNLCTLYELHTDLHTHKKVQLLEQVHSSLGDGFPLKNFKLN